MQKNYFIIFLLFFSILCVKQTYAQNSNEDALFIKKIYNQILNDGDCYDWLHQLSTDYGGALFGDQIKPLRATALGNSPGGKAKAEVIEVFSLDEVEKLGRDAIEGKIVFYNRPMDPTQIRTFNAYGGAVDQRGTGPAIASRYGAVATVVRSMTTKTDGVPHTGVTIFGEDKPTPAAAISTLDADWLSAQLKKGNVEISIETHGQLLPDEISHNVIGDWSQMLEGLPHEVFL